METDQKTAKIINKEKNKTSIVSKDRIKIDKRGKMDQKPAIEKWEFPKPYQEFKERRYPSRIRRPPDRLGNPLIDLPNSAGRNVRDSYLDRD